MKEANVSNVISLSLFGFGLKEDAYRRMETTWKDGSSKTMIARTRLAWPCLAIKPLPCAFTASLRQKAVTNRKGGCLILSGFKLLWALVDQRKGMELTLSSIMPPAAAASR